MAPVPKPVYSIQVRALVEFALRCGDLGSGGDFVRPRRALAGTRGHQRVQRSRPPGYQKEVRLAYEIQNENFTLKIQGRIDGLIQNGSEVVLEEIKTVERRWDGVPDPLHWAQAKCYGFIYARDQAIPNLVIQLTYLDLESERTTEFRQLFSFAELAAFFEQTTRIYLEWLGEWFQFCRRRDDSILHLDFPYAGYRLGQRDLAVAVYRTMLRGGRLFLEAPTGIGKTMSVLFPALKALSEGKLERIFYLTARTIGRAVAHKAFADLRQNGLRLRTLTLTAKDKICVRDGQPCDPQTCPLARGYYDRRKAAMREALQKEDLTRATLEQIGQAHQVCPFELSLDLSTWVDAVICDYNYVFDPRAYLRRHFDEDATSYGLLIDEAHNLVERAREMFSAELDGEALESITPSLSKAVPRCAKGLRKLTSALGKLSASAGLAAEPAGQAWDPLTELNLFAQPSRPATPGISRTSHPLVSTASGQSCARRELPTALLPLLQDVLDHAEEWLARNETCDFRQALLELYFQLYAFTRTAEVYDERFVTIIEAGKSVRIRLFCLDPSFLLGLVLARTKAAVFFSATLSPLDYYQTLLGGQPAEPHLQLPSPFPSENLALLVQDNLRTHFKDRAETLERLVHSIGALIAARRGNYLIYFPSYQYLAAGKELFQKLNPAVSVLSQRPAMGEADREAFLDAFAAEHHRTLVGFAVMGGIFGEGIDLVGERLIGVVIVGVGLPQLCLERDLVRDYFQARNGAGFEYAYTFPGMNRVLQATGRVIRSEKDRGVVLLIDARFAQSRYLRLFPKSWRPVRVRSSAQIRHALAQFWEPPD